jgi:hypothetical protein
MSARIEEARKVALALLDDLEGGSAPVDAILMRAMRLARLMRDTDAQLWLGYEIRGYPPSETFVFSTLGSCEKYAVAGGRINPETNTYYPKSLPEIEAIASSQEATLRSFEKVGGGSPTMENYLVKRATEEFINGQLKLQKNYREAYNSSKGIIASMRSAIHGYVTDTYLAIELGDVAQDIFETARRDVDTFVRAHCPKAAEQLVAINERMADHSAESRTAALTTCRRLLMTVADSLFPAREGDWADSTGKARKVGEEQYKNRLLAYLEDKARSRGSQEVIVSGLEHLAARLDAIYEKTCKGVHVDVSEQEARLAVIHTYLFIGEVANSTQTAETGPLRG